MRRNNKSFFSKIYRIIILAMCIITLGSVFAFTYMRFTEYKNLKIVENSILMSIEQEAEVQKQLEFEIEYGMTDSFIEKAAREKLGLVKQTDIIFIDNNK